MVVVPAETRVNAHVAARINMTEGPARDAVCNGILAPGATLR